MRMFQDFTGVPAIAPGDPVGVALSDVQSPVILPNVSWGSLWSEVSPGVYERTSAGFSPVAQTSKNSATGEYYGLELEILEVVSGSILVFRRNPSNTGNETLATYSFPGVYEHITRASVVYSPGQGHSGVWIDSNNFVGKIRISGFKFYPGIHLEQGTQSSKPTLARIPKGGSRTLVTSHYMDPSWLVNSTTKNAIALPTFAEGPDAVAVTVTSSGGAGARITRMLTITASANMVSYRALVRPVFPISGGIAPGQGVELGSTTTGFHAVLVNTAGVVNQFSSSNSSRVLYWHCIPKGDGWYDMAITVDTSGFAGNMQAQITYRGASISTETYMVDISSPQIEFGPVSPYQLYTNFYDITEGQNRYNLHNHTEDASNPYWQKSALTVSGKLLRATGSTNSLRFFRPAADVVGVPTGAPYIVSMDIWPGNTTKCVLLQEGGGGSWRVNIDLAAGTFESSGSASNVSMVPVSGAPNKYRIRVRGVRNGGARPYVLFLHDYGNSPPESSLYVDRVSMEHDRGVRPYQKVVTGYEDFGGVPSVWHLYNDGGDSLSAVMDEAGVYGVGRVDHLGNVTTYNTGNIPVGSLYQAFGTGAPTRVADYITRLGAFNAENRADLKEYWEARYKA